VRALVLADTRAGADTDEGRRKRRDMIELARAQGSVAVADQMLTGMVGKTTRERHPDTVEAVRAMLAAAPVDGVVGALEALAAIPEPVAPPPAVVPREVTIGQQIVVLLEALSDGGRVVLQTILAGCRSRTEAAVTFLATLELVRRRQAVAEQADPFGPIVIQATPKGAQ
jgi:hypothetical protein